MNEEEEIPLTELEQDQLNTGFFFFLANPVIYNDLSSYVAQSRSLPINGEKASTLRGLPPAEELMTTTDGSGQLMLKLSHWRVTPDDLTAIQPYIAQGFLSIVTELEWLSVKPEPTEEL